jgi:hypothetical protein
MGGRDWARERGKLQSEKIEQGGGLGTEGGRGDLFNPFTASCENAMSLSVPGVPAPCEKFPKSSQLNFK